MRAHQPPDQRSILLAARLAVKRVYEGNSQAGVLVQQDVDAPSQPPALGAAAVAVGRVDL
jgi:hypothetical protein